MPRSYVIPFELTARQNIVYFTARDLNLKIKKYIYTLRTLCTAFPNQIMPGYIVMNISCAFHECFEWAEKKNGKKNRQQGSVSFMKQWYFILVVNALYSTPRARDRTANSQSIVSITEGQKRVKCVGILYSITPCTILLYFFSFANQ